jgi:hypothetical protein
MAGMIELLIGTIMARIIVAFIRNRTKNSTNISWVFRTIKMSGLKFDLLCRGIALGLIVLFYLLHLIGISKILPYTYIAFMYIEVVVLFIEPLKAEAECCLLIKEVPEEVFGYKINPESPRVDREKGCVLISSLMEVYPMSMIYLKIVDNTTYELFMDYSYIIIFIILDLWMLIERIRDDKRFRRLENQYYEEKFRSYYRK